MESPSGVAIPGALFCRVYKNVWSAAWLSSRIFERLGVVCKNVSGLLLERAPCHDEDPRVPILIKGQQHTWHTARLIICDELRISVA